MSNVRNVSTISTVHLIENLSLSPSLYVSVPIKEFDQKIAFSSSKRRGVRFDPPLRLGLTLINIMSALVYFEFQSHILHQFDMHFNAIT